MVYIMVIQTHVYSFVYLFRDEMMNTQVVNVCFVMIR